MSKITWLKLGYSEEQAERLSELEKIPFTVAPIDDIDDATEDLLEAMDKYEDVELDDNAVDALNEVSEVYPITSEELKRVEITTDNCIHNYEFLFDSKMKVNEVDNCEVYESAVIVQCPRCYTQKIMTMEDWQEHKNERKKRLEGE